jgi:outer membrane protein TolC
VTLALVRPLGNRAAGAAYERSQHGQADARLALREEENRIHREVGDALSRVYTARDRVALAGKNVEFAELAFEKLIDRREKIGDVTAIEVVETSRTVLDARTELVRALVGHKLAEGELLAAQGIIANQYAQSLARNEFERNRLALLAAHDGLRFFAPLDEE